MDLETAKEIATSPGRFPDEARICATEKILDGITSSPVFSENVKEYMDGKRRLHTIIRSVSGMGHGFEFYKTMAFLMAFYLGGQSRDYLAYLNKKDFNVGLSDLTPEGLHLLGGLLVQNPSLTLSLGLEESNLSELLEPHREVLATSIVKARLDYQRKSVVHAQLDALVERRDDGSYDHEAWIKANDAEKIKEESAFDLYSCLRLSSRGQLDEVNILISGQPYAFQKDGRFACLTVEDSRHLMSVLSECEGRYWDTLAYSLRGLPEKVALRVIALAMEFGNSPYRRFSSQEIVLYLVNDLGVTQLGDIDEAEAVQLEAFVGGLDGEKRFHLKRILDALCPGFSSDVPKFLLKNPSILSEILDSAFAEELSYLNRDLALTMQFFSLLVPLQKPNPAFYVGLSKIIDKTFMRDGVHPTIQAQARQLLNPLFLKLQLPTEKTLHAWGQSKDKERVRFIQKCLKRSLELSEIDPELPRHLYRTYGVLAHGRYEKNSLLKQVSEERARASLSSTARVQGEFILILKDRKDHNGALHGEGSFRDHRNWDNPHPSNMPVVYCEMDGKYATTRRLLNILNIFGSPKCIFANSHSNGERIGPLRVTDFSGKGVSRLLRRLTGFAGVPVIMGACSAGQDGGIAQAVSASTASYVLGAAEECSSKFRFDGDRTYHVSYSDPDNDDDPTITAHLWKGGELVGTGAGFNVSF